MPRKMISVAVGLALLVLTSGAAQAQLAAAQPVPACFFEQLWEWAASSLAPIFTKDGTAADPNGRLGKVLPGDAREVNPETAHRSKREM